MKKLYLCLIMIAVFAVSACGGGGGTTVPDPVPAKLEGLEGRWSLHIEYGDFVPCPPLGDQYVGGTINDEWLLTEDKIYSSTHLRENPSGFKTDLVYEYDGATLFIPKLIVRHYYPPWSKNFDDSILELSIRITPGMASATVVGMYKSRGSSISESANPVRYYWDYELAASGIMNKLPD